MKILYITPSFQHPKMRGSPRHYYFIRELAQRHAITLLTPTVSEVPREVMAEMSGYTEKLLTFKASPASNSFSAGLGNHLPFLGGRLKQLQEFQEICRQMKMTFLQLIRQNSFDVVLFHGKRLFPVINDGHKLPMVVDFCDATSMRVKTKIGHVNLAQRFLLALYYLYIRSIERRLVGLTPHLAFISCRDREAILGPASTAQVIPNGVDLQYWQRQTYSPRPKRLIFTGVMNYAPNEDAALYLIHKILPRLKQSIPDVELFIVGRDPTATLVEQTRPFPEVTVTGFVEDMRPYLEEATVFAAPLRYASGMQNKIQEALAMGVPVVTTSIVADGLRTEAGQRPPVWVADGEQNFANALLNLLGQEAERARLSMEGRGFAERYFVWPRSADQLEQMCLNAAG